MSGGREGGREVKRVGRGRCGRGRSSS